MKLKTLALAVAILAVLSAITCVVQRPAPPPSADARIGQPLAPAATLEQAAHVRLSDQGKIVLLVKQSDGTWHVPGYYDLPADFAKLARLVGDLTGAKIQRLVTSNPERIARLEFKDTQVTFLDGSDKELWSVTLGRTAENGGRFVRFGTEQKAYLANLNADVDTEAKNWADTQLLNLKADDIARVELAFPGENATVAATRAKKEDSFAAERSPDGRKLKADSVTNLIGSFATLRFSDTSDPTDANAVAAKAHARTLKLVTFDGKSVTIAVGRKPEEKVVKAPTAPADAAKGGPAAVLDTDKKDAGPVKTLENATETVPAGPVFAFVTSSDAAAPINALMQKRAFQIAEYTFTSLPQKLDDMFEPAPTPAPAATAPAPEKPAETK